MPCTRMAEQDTPMDPNANLREQAAQIRIGPGVYAVTIGAHDAYRIRRERDEAGRLRWFAFGDGPNNPIAAGETLRACFAALR